MAASTASRPARPPSSPCFATRHRSGSTTARPGAWPGSRSQPPPPRRLGRWVAAGAAAALVATLLTAIFVGFGDGSTQASKAAALLPAPWKISVDVLNGSGDINYTRQVATHVGSFGYRIGHVTKANRFGYKQTVIYFEPGGEALARRLSSQLGCGTISPLPGGRDARRLVVITGPPSPRARPAEPDLLTRG